MRYKLATLIIALRASDKRWKDYPHPDNIVVIEKMKIELGDYVLLYQDALHILHLIYGVGYNNMNKDDREYVKSLIDIIDEFSGIKPSSDILTPVIFDIETDVMVGTSGAHLHHTTGTNPRVIIVDTLTHEPVIPKETMWDGDEALSTLNLDKTNREQRRAKKNKEEI